MLKHVIGFGCSEVCEREVSKWACFFERDLELEDSECKKHLQVQLDSLITEYEDIRSVHEHNRWKQRLKRSERVVETGLSVADAVTWQTWLSLLTQLRNSSETGLSMLLLNGLAKNYRFSTSANTRYTLNFLTPCENFPRLRRFPSTTYKKIVIF